MVDAQDWKAAISSEVFREYLKNELTKEAQMANVPSIDSDAIVEQFHNFQAQVNQDPKLLKAFQVLQKKFAQDEVYRNKTNPIFVEAVMMLELQDIEAK